MSREQTFVWVIRKIALPVALIGQAAGATYALVGEPRRITVRAPEMIGPQTENNLAPILRCSAAGGEVVLSLGGDGSSVYVYCTKVKS